MIKNNKANTKSEHKFTSLRNRLCKHILIIFDRALYHIDERTSLPNLKLRHSKNNSMSLSSTGSGNDVQSMRMHHGSSSNLGFNPKIKQESLNKIMRKFKQKQTRNAAPSYETLRKFESMPKYTKEPTLEAVLNCSSQLRLNLPTMLPHINRSISKRIKHLPLNDTHIPQRETSRLHHAEPLGAPTHRYHDKLEELNDDIQRFEDVVKNEKPDQPLYFHGHIIRKVGKKHLKLKMQHQDSPDNPLSPVQKLETIEDEQDPVVNITQSTKQAAINKDDPYVPDKRVVKQKSAIFPKGINMKIINEDQQDPNDETKTAF